ncbi:hypothetical protein ABK040_013165 [Willaertia magna]
MQSEEDQNTFGDTDNFRVYRGRGRGRGRGHYNRGGYNNNNTYPSEFNSSNRGGRGRGRGRGRGGYQQQQGSTTTGGSYQQQRTSTGHYQHQQGTLATRRGTKNNVNFFIIRKPLQGSTAFTSTNKTLSPTIPSEPSDEMGKSFYKELKQFVEDGNAFVHDFPNTLNLAQRKRVHALAEEFRLDHFSRGSNPFRYICVTKRNQKMKDEFQYFGYIGLFGHSIDELVRTHTLEPTMQNQPLLQKRVKRDGPIHHITLMTRPEINTALKNLLTIKEYENLLDENQKQLMKQGTEEEKIEILMNVISKVVIGDYKAIGLGKVTQEETQSSNTDNLSSSQQATSSGEEKKMNEAYFVVINWPSAQKLRTTLGLEPYHFHITVAYKYGDIHGVIKDESTLQSKVFEMKSELLEKLEKDMSNFLKYVGVNERYAHSFITLGWFSVDSLAMMDRMDLNDLGVFSEEDQDKILNKL